MATQTPEPLRLFISYSRGDRAMIDPLVERIEAHGLDAVLDTEDIAPGEDWRLRLSGMIAKAHAVVVCISRHSLASEICRWELQQATALSKRLIPVLVDSVDTAAIPPELARLNLIVANDQTVLHSAAAAVVETARTDVDWVRMHTELGHEARGWTDSGHRQSYLLRGERLEAAELWLAARYGQTVTPSPLHEEFIVKSRVHQNNQRSASRKTGAIILFFNLGLTLVAACAGTLILSMGSSASGQLDYQELKTRCQREVSSLRRLLDRNDTIDNNRRTRN